MTSLACLNEDTVASFVEGRLEVEAMSAVEVHAATCADCKHLLAAALRSATLLEAPLLEAGDVDFPADERPRREPLVRGTVIGRYTILELKGRGGMGEVYAAYDGELDRKVALKLLHARAGGDVRAEARLLREARAMAKVSHSNVVTVHEAGTFGGRVFIAMEFVDGPTLREWLARGSHGRVAILEKFAMAARGLAAAHAAGLVHRDFKPQNVMLAHDGTVRVMDFGLARAIDDTAEAFSAREGIPSHVAGTVDLTRTGELLGTPAYMAPEQYLSQATNARTDQFSFCVTLYEALYKERPFADETFKALMGAVTTGAVRDAPAGAHVPTWMRRALLRGLDPDPGRRHPSMEALLTALATDPTKKSRRLVLGGLGLVCLLGLAIGAQRLAGTRSSLCRGGVEKLAEVWEPSHAPSPRKERIRAAFSSSGKSYASQAYAGVEGLLDEYVGKWLAMYRDACEATQVRGEQSPEVLDLRMTCLNERLASVRALTGLFVVADGSTVENAIPAAGSLPGLEGCADVASLRAVVRAPKDAATRRQVEQLDTERARLSALGDSGHCSEAKSFATELVRKVRETGYRPLLARTLAAAGLLSNDCVSGTQGLAWLREAYLVAVEAHDDDTATEAATLSGAFLALRVHRPEEERLWLDIARASLDRGGSRPLLEAWWFVSDGAVLLDLGKPTDAVTALRRALEIKTNILGARHLDVVRSMNSLGEGLMADGRWNEALQSFMAAAAAAQGILGAEHPFVGQPWNNVGEVLNLLGRHAEAKEAFERSLAILGRSDIAPELTAYPLTGLGRAELGAGRPEKAIAPLERALKARTEHEVAPELRGETRFALARALWSRAADRPRAVGLARAALKDGAQTPTAGAEVAAIDDWIQRAEGAEGQR